MRTRAHVLMQYKALHACAHACAVISLAQFLVMADWSVDKPLDEPRTLFVKDGVYYMDTEVGGLRIPKIRHAGGPDWETELGPIKELVEKLHNKSQQHGWILRYWSHEAMDAKMNACDILSLRDAYFAIRQEYRAQDVTCFGFTFCFFKVDSG